MDHNYLTEDMENIRQEQASVELLRAQFKQGLSGASIRVLQMVLSRQGKIAEHEKIIKHLVEKIGCKKVRVEDVEDFGIQKIT